MLQIDFAKTDDAEAFIALQHIICDETDFLLLSKEELNSDVEKQRLAFEAFQASDSVSKVLLAKVDGELAGYIGYGFQSLRRVEHVVNRIAVAVQKKYQRQGIGKALFRNAEDQWLSKSIKRAEFTVVTENLAAVEMYESLGYRKEGERESSLYVKGRYYNEYYMGKVFR